MDQSQINALTYANLNKLSVGFLSIVVPLSSSLAGCLTYQFINYLNTKMFTQTQAQHQMPNHVQKQMSPSPAYHQTHQFQEKPKKIAYLDRNNNEIEGEVVVGQLETKKAEELDVKPRSLPLHPSTFHSNYQPEFFDIRVDNQHDYSCNRRNWFSRLNIFHQQFEFLNDKFNVLVFFILMANLFSLALEILVFKSLAHHTLVDAGLTRVYSWQLSNLLVVNFLISTGTRVYFARLASTMLRAPKLFLVCSLILLLISLGGLIFQSVLVGAHLIDYDQIRVIFTRSGSVDQTLTDFVNDLGDYFRLIGLHRIRLDILQLAWLGPPLAWDLLITTVLMFNALDSRKRCRFGSADGRISLGITIMFETMFLVTLATFIVLCICLVLGGKVAIDFERMNTLYGGFDGFVTKLHTISIFCSLQHKVNDRLRLEQKLIISSQRTRDSALSGYGLGHSVGSGDPTYHGRQSTRKGPQAVQFPDFAETDLEVSEEDGSVVVEGSEENEFDERNVDDETEEENTSVHATENLRVNRLAPAIECCNSAHLSQKQIVLNKFNVEDFDVKFPEQAKIMNHHHVAKTSEIEGLASGPVVDCPPGLQSNLGLKIFEDPQELIDAQHHHIRPHHAHSNPNPNFKSAVSSPRPGFAPNQSIP
ncbi:hypothetical protein PTTG_27089 [Puccinia triticina 1-1 BBBD Race 1]|uniref:Uncharacterized protein n=1 Tax=Puccinia triticina (isolate 1-1 / race 1 (BBBD)) TaxID=630390 RepID=A0A180GN36_PUCT1|nr:hypothetical protein PTTG_27089 [Puccinia triticina 1-1 BBBD Race 1]